MLKAIFPLILIILAFSFSHAKEKKSPAPKAASVAPATPAPSPEMIAAAAATQAAAGNACPVQNTQRPFTSAFELNTYLRNNREAIQKPEDLVCCMVRDMNMKVVIAHHSVAAQTGKPESPRAMLYSENAKGEMGFAISVNGGEFDMAQGESVEMMFNDPNRNEVEYYDLPFTNENPQHRTSTRNPEACMMCHGNVSGSTGGGPRTLFDAKPWQRYAQSSNGNVALRNPNCPQEDALRQQHSRTAIEAVNSNPRFKCVNDLINKNNVRIMDEHLAELNDRRIAKIIFGTKDYHRYKFVYLGLDICSDALSWIPANRLTELNGEGLILPTNRAATPANALQIIKDARARKEVNNVALGAQYDAMARGGPPVFNPQDAGTSCKPDAKTKIELPTGAVSPTHFKYQVEELAMNRQVKMSDYRFLFEGRGYDISDWGMSPSENYTRRPFLLPWLTKLDTPGSRIGQIFAGITDFKNIPAQKKSQICAQLKTEATASLAIGGPRLTPAADPAVEQ